MTAGSPGKILRSFTLPMLLSMAFQQLYNIVDSIIAGNFIGIDALAAVGASYPITVLFLAVASGASTGCSVVVSQLFGAKRCGDMKTAVSTAIISIGVLAVALMVSGAFLCDSLMRMIQTPDNIFDESALYLRIYIFGMAFLFLYNAANAIFNALGDSKTPLYFLIFSSCLNVVLDLLFVAVFKLGVAGVAWATFTAQGISSVLAVFALLIRLKKIRTNEPSKYFDGKMLLGMGRIAVPSILQQSFVSVGQLFVQGLINQCDKGTIAGYSAAFKINTLIITSLITTSNALANFTAQNIGAHKMKRVTRGFKISLSMTVSICTVLIAAVLIFTPQLIGLFVSNEADADIASVINSGTMFLRIGVPFHMLVAFKVCSDAVLRGAGKMKYFMLGTFSDLLLRVIFSYILFPGYGFLGICLSYPIGWIVGSAISVIFYFNKSWMPERFRHLRISHSD